MSSNTVAQGERLYPIRTVASLTGVNPVTLRAWERRYQLIKPQRTPKGHRLYTDTDIALIKQVLGLLDQGISISQAKHLIGKPGKPVTETLDQSAGPWKSYQEDMLAAINEFDVQALDALYNDVLSLYPVDIVSSRLVSPMLEELGSAWKDDAAGIAKEHFLTTFLRNKLGTRFHHLNMKGTGPRLLAACLPGEYHEIGLLQFSLSAVSHGYRIVLLGANVPMDQLAIPAERARCSGIVLSGSSGKKHRQVCESLRELVSEISLPVFIGGLFSTNHPENIEAAGAIPVGTDYQTALERISAMLALSA